MQKIGVVICVVGTIGAILHPPLELRGIGVGWGFILADQGFGTYSYDFINMGTLLIELLIINGIGLALFFLGRRQAVGQ
jgi:hypothetical protein